MTNASLLVVVFIQDMSQYKPTVMRLEQQLQYSATIYPVLEDRMFSLLPAFLSHCDAKWVMFMRFNDSLADNFRAEIYPLLEKLSRPDGVAVLGLQNVPETEPGIRAVERTFAELLTFNEHSAAFGNWISDRLCAYEVWSWASRQKMEKLFSGHELQAMELLLPLSLCMRVGYTYNVPSPFSIYAKEPVPLDILNTLRRFFIRQWMGFITI